MPPGCAQCPQPRWHVLLVLLFATAAAARNTLWQAPQTPPTQLGMRRRRVWRPQPIRRAALDQETEVMRCIGTRFVDRACMVHDLYYDTETRTFKWYGSTIIPDRGEAPVPATSKTFAAATTYIKVAAGKGNLAQREFTVKWSKAAPPDAGGANTCTVEMPIHLRREGPVGTHSFGHMMRDNYYHLTAVPRRFGVGAHTFSWVTWPRKKGKNAQARIPIMERVNKLLSPHPSMRWFEVERACRNGDNTLGPDTVTNSPRYIRLKRVLMSGAADSMWTSAKACGRSDWTVMRDHAYSILGITPRPAHPRPARVRVAIVRKTRGDKRQLIVSQAAIDAVRKAYPQVDVDMHTASREDEGVQIRWLSQTDILLTNIGSASFRMLYLPDGAQVVMAGALESTYYDVGGEKSAFLPKVWGEVTKCWDALPYFRVHRYHIEDPNDVVLKRMRRRIGSNPRHNANVQLRDSDVVMRPKPLVEAVGAAIKQLEKDSTRYVQQVE